MKFKLDDMNKEATTEAKICKCHCHQDGDVYGSHTSKCCRLAYQKYIDKNTNIDLVRYCKLQGNC